VRLSRPRAGAGAEGGIGQANSAVELTSDGGISSRGSGMEARQGMRFSSTKTCVFSNIKIVQGLSRFAKKDQD
jgi:hypothetical protein